MRTAEVEDLVSVYPEDVGSWHAHQLFFFHISLCFLRLDNIYASGSFDENLHPVIR